VANFNWESVITWRSVVVVTASEYDPIFVETGIPIPGPGSPPGPGVPQVPPHDFRRFVGDANIWVANIAPHGPNVDRGDPGGVSFVVNVDFYRPLPVVVDIVVFDNPEELFFERA
jgi:hypothetical protein